MRQIIKKVVSRIKTITPLTAFTLIVLLAIIVLGIKYFGKKETWLSIRLEVKGQNWTQDFSSGKGFGPPLFFIPYLETGETETGIDKLTIAKITNVEAYGKVKPAIYLTASVKAIYDSNTKKYSFKNRYVDVGSPIELRLPKVSVVGQVTHINFPTNGYPQKNFLATVRIRDIEPWLVNKITVGDKMYNLSNNQAVAEILTKSIESPVSNVYFNNAGFFTNQFLEVNPRLRDVVLTMRMQMTKLPEGWVFAGNQVPTVGSLDNFLKLSFQDYYLPYVELEDLRDETTP